MYFLKLILSMLLMRHGSAQDEVFVLGNHHCITNGSPAIVFNEAPNVTPSSSHQRSSFYPMTSDPYYFACDLDGVCRKKESWVTHTGWSSIVSSLDGLVKKYVTDRRWEAFPATRTVPVKQKEDRLDFYRMNYHRTDASSFVMPISVRGEKEGHVFLCEDEREPPNSNCYWIMLAAFSGKQSGIRKCHKNQIPAVDGKYPDSPCKDLQAVNRSPDVLNEVSWTHFKIIKNKNKLKVLRDNEDFLEFNDTSNDTFGTQSIYFHSKGVDILWKIHQYTYLYTDTTNNGPLGPPFKVQGNTLCISMFMAICDTCSLTLKIKTEGEKDLVFNETYYSTNGMWKEIKVIRDLSKWNDEILQLFSITQQILHSTDKGFWAMDDIRLCNEAEYRYIKSGKSGVPCQMISVGRNDKILATRKNDDIKSYGVNCSENYFGKWCIPYETFGANLGTGFKYCEGFGDRKECHCSAGFEGKNCDTKCSSGTYGHGCQKKCSRFCEGDQTCRFVDGNCYAGCKENFKGLKCYTVQEPFLDSPPIVVNTTFSSANVKLEKFDVIGNIDSNSKYQLQYIEDDNQYETETETADKNGQHVWKNIGSDLAINDSQFVTISNLESDTYYKVRAVITTHSARTAKKMEVDKDFVKSARLKTKCLDISDTDIDIIESDTTAAVTVQKSANMCRLKRYNYTVGGISKPVLENFTLSSLKPFKEYSLIIKNVINGKTILQKDFRTLEGIPSKIRNIAIRESVDRLDISWEGPEYENGIVQYKIKWQFLYRIPCLYIRRAKVNETNISTASISLVDLKSYSLYNISIEAFTRAGSGKPLTVLANTSSSASLSVKENISIVSLNPGQDNVTVEVTKVNCDDMEGPIHLKLQASCSNEWCLKPVERNYPYPIYGQSITLNQLLPFSNYTVVMKVSRTLTDWKQTSTKMFQTEPSVPNAISELEAYSKDLESISLRWRPPYPPTGILKEYEITYSYYYAGYHFNVSPLPCKLWPEFHCADINNHVYENYKYTITVQAINEKPYEYGKESNEIKVTIKEEAPKPPYGVHYFWEKNNDLNISWYHPNQTNGQLKSFEIQLYSDWVQKYNKSYRLASKDDYKLIYSLKIEANRLTSCSNYTMRIRSLNVYFPSNFIRYNIITPPQIPPDISKEEIHYNSTNTTITIRMEYQDDVQGIYTKTIYIVVSKPKDTKDLLEFSNCLLNGTEPVSTTSKIVWKSDRNTFAKMFVIGENPTNTSSYSNPPLEPGTNYSIAVFFLNECYNMTRLKMTQKYMITTGDPNLVDEEELTSPVGEDGNNDSLWALLLLLLVPIIGFGYWYLKRKQGYAGGELRSKRDSAVDVLPLTDRNTEIPRVNVVKPKKSVPTQILPPLQTKYSKRIRLVDFVDYVKEAVENGELENQHDLFPRGLLQKCERGSMTENKTKNRYKNLIAYDHTRVKLRKIPGDEFSDYINANYIDGYKKPRVYIATQGPKSSTLADFWRMVWQENVKNIVMLASIFENGKKKVEKYWPDINETSKYGSVTVKFVSQKVFANFDLRIFDVFYRQEKRQVEQLHFTTWPDHGVPLYPQSLVPFLQRMLKIPYNPVSPMLVHCSAGVGRTGTIILCDICLRMAAGENAMDFLAHVENLRDQRANMVDNLEQYKLAHVVVMECLFGMRTAIPCSKDMEQLVETVLENDGVVQQMKYLHETLWQDTVMETMLEKEAPVLNSAHKNRFPEIVPEHYRVFLSHYPVGDPTSSYINAVLVDDFRNPGRYIVTQQPMPNTVGDFWRLLIERGCSVIINLNKVITKDKSVCKFWPTKDKEMSPVDFLMIRHVNTKKLEFYEIITVLVEIENTKEKISVDIISLNSWKPGELLPSNTEEFLAFRDAADAISRNSSNIIVTCYDGATASGLYLAMSFLIERMKLEQECDVCLAVRSIRHSRRQFVTSMEQYEYLFKASLAFITGFQSYANFE